MFYLDQGFKTSIEGPHRTFSCAWLAKKCGQDSWIHLALVICINIFLHNESTMHIF
jgi:hypothetical protein